MNQPHPTADQVKAAIEREIAVAEKLRKMNHDEGYFLGRIVELTMENARQEQVIAQQAEELRKYRPDAVPSVQADQLTDQPTAASVELPFVDAVVDEADDAHWQALAGGSGGTQ